MKSKLKFFIIFIVCLFSLNCWAKIQPIQLPYSFPTSAMLDKMEERLQTLPTPKIIGLMKDFSHYLGVIDLIMLASQETPNCRHFIKEKILGELKNYNTIIDIGTGSGENTQFIAQNFKKVVLIDPESKALDTLNFQQLPNCTELVKINSLFQETNVKSAKADLVVFAHVFYYFPVEEWLPLLKKAYEILEPGGIIFVVFNRGGSREELVKHFTGKFIDFNHFQNLLTLSFPQAETFISQEAIFTRSIEAMAQLSGLFLKDVGAKADRKVIEEYIKQKFQQKDGFLATMEQTFIKIKKI